MDTVAQPDNAQTDIFPPTLPTETQDPVSQCPQKYFEEITELERYVDSRITGYRSIWRDEEIKRSGKSPKSQDGADPFYYFLIEALGKGEKEIYLDGTITHQFEEYKNKAISTIGLFKHDSTSLIKSLKKKGDHFCEYCTLFEKFVAEIRDIRKELKTKYTTIYRDIAKDCADKHTHPKYKNIPVQAIDITMESHFCEWKEFEDESLRGVYDHVTRINAALNLEPCDRLGAPEDPDKRMYG